MPGRWQECGALGIEATSAGWRGSAGQVRRNFRQWSLEKNFFLRIPTLGEPSNEVGRASTHWASQYSLGKLLRGRWASQY